MFPQTKNVLNLHRQLWKDKIFVWGTSKYKVDGHWVPPTKCGYTLSHFLKVILSEHRECMEFETSALNEYSPSLYVPILTVICVEVILLDIFL